MTEVDACVLSFLRETWDLLYTQEIVKGVHVKHPEYTPTQINEAVLRLIAFGELKRDWETRRIVPLGEGPSPHEKRLLEALEALRGAFPPLWGFTGILVEGKHLELSFDFGGPFSLSWRENLSNRWLLDFPAQMGEVPFGNVGTLEHIRDVLYYRGLNFKR